MRNPGWLVSSFVLTATALVGCSSSQPVGPSAVSSALVAEPSASSAGASAAPSSAAGGRPASPGIVYVRSQGLYYDTFVTADSLPMRGRFQAIGDTDMDGIPDTEYGPGDRGYLGGRWWADVNANGVQDEEDDFFLCPLLGPGRQAP